MNTKAQNSASRTAPDRNVIVLGIATVETKGIRPVGEDHGGNRNLGISDE